MSNLSDDAVKAAIEGEIAKRAAEIALCEKRKSELKKLIQDLDTCVTFIDNSVADFGQARGAFTKYYVSEVSMTETKDYDQTVMNLLDVRLDVVNAMDNAAVECEKLDKRILDLEHEIKGLSKQIV